MKTVTKKTMGAWIISITVLLIVFVFIIVPSLYEAVGTLTEEDAKEIQQTNWLTQLVIIIMFVTILIAIEIVGRIIQIRNSKEEKGYDPINPKRF